MSRRRKHVRNLVDEALPELTEGDEVCRVTELRGGNQVEVRLSPRLSRAHRRRRPSRPPHPRLPPPDPHVSNPPTRDAQVEKADGASTLIRIPAKFSKVLWVRKGTHVLAHIEPNLPDDVKVTGELLRVLYKAQIREMRKDGTWPRAFDDSYDDDDAMDDDGWSGGGGHGVDVQRGALEGLSIGGAGSGGDDDDDDDGLPPLAANRNRRPLRREVESSSESEDGEEEEEDGDDSSDEE